MAAQPNEGTQEGERLSVRCKTLVMTCGACPSQWEGVLEDGRQVYARYRGGRVRIYFGAPGQPIIDFLDEKHRVFCCLYGADMDGCCTFAEITELSGLEAPAGYTDRWDNSRDTPDPE